MLLSNFSYFKMFTSLIQAKPKKKKKFPLFVWSGTQLIDHSEEKVEMFWFTKIKLMFKIFDSSRQKKKIKKNIIFCIHVCPHQKLKCKSYFHKKVFRKKKTPQKLRIEINFFTIYYLIFKKIGFY